MNNVCLQAMQEPLYCYRFYKSTGEVRQFIIDKTKYFYNPKWDCYEFSSLLTGVDTPVETSVYKNQIDRLCKVSRDYALIFSFNKDLNAELIFKGWMLREIYKHQKELYKFNRMLASMEGKC